MKTDVLLVREDRNGFSLTWCCDDWGASVGEYPDVILVKPACDGGDDWDFFLAEYIARQHTEEKPGRAFSWDTVGEAKKVLRTIKAEWKAALTVWKAPQVALRAAKKAAAVLPQDWPEWAQTALAHGWKPPKGWAPGATNGEA